ncbi:MAG: hypothetical protein R3E90_03770 [Marinicella sp.]|nr:hypothetical protein [Xanthomonadales bacterium]
MIILTGFFYSLYFMILGFAARASYHLLNRTELLIEKKTDFSAHALFLGIFLHVLIFNMYQFIGLSNIMALYFTMFAVVLASVTIFFLAKKIGFHTVSIKPTSTNIIALVFIAVCSSIIFWNGIQLPEMAWDSWMVWIGKANQWANHGVATPVYPFDEWLNKPNSIYNESAHYPDALPLLYLLPKLLGWNSYGTLLTFHLIVFAMMTLLLVSRLERKGAPWYLQLILVIVIYTTPLLNNHLMITGYADIWMAMFIVIIMLTLIDYHEKGDNGVGITLLCYLAMLPMLKLEGWVWLLLFMIAHILVSLANNPHRFKLLGIFIGFIFILWILGGLHLNFPFGNIIINSEKIEFLHLINAKISFSNITSEVLIGFFRQNNWSILWLGLPFLLVSFVANKQDKASQVAHVFFILALACFFFLFYFTQASQWAKDLTAINRVVLQLVPCYIFLLFKMLIRLNNIEIKKAQTQ